MPRGDRMRYGVYLIVFLAVLSFPGLANSWQLDQPREYATPGESPDQQRQAASHHNGHFGNLAVFIQLGADAGGFYKAQYTDPRGYRENERADRDLRAQEEMAKWAYWMMVLTGATVLVTFVGVLLVGFTLTETRRLRREAEKTTMAALDATRFSEEGAVATLKAAEAAIEANKLNRETMIAEQRAWVSLQDAKITKPIRWGDKGGRIEITLFLENIGKTVASRVWVTCKTHLNLYRNNAYDLVVDEFRKERFRQMPIGIAIVPSVKPTPLTQDIGIEVSQIEELKGIFGDAMSDNFAIPKINIVGCITYQISYSKEIKQTIFILEILGKKGSDGKITIIAPGGSDIPQDNLIFRRDILRDMIMD